MSRLRVVAHYVAARRRRFATRAALERHQQRLLADVLRRAPERYPYYRARFPGEAPSSLADLPVLDKPDVLEHFAALNVRGVALPDALAAARTAERGRDFSTALRGLSVGLSSGTSGQQTAFLTSGAERDRWAGEVLARALPDGLLAGARITLVLRAGGPLYEAVGSRRVAFTFVDLALPREKIVAQVVASRPTILVAPPSVLVALAGASAASAGDLAASPLLPRLRRLFSAAEVLDPHDRARIEAGLGLRVDAVYQAAEGFLGMSCARGTLHLAEDLVLVERERVPGFDDGRFVPVVTDLVRTSQAVLRRRLGDVLVPGECDCGDARLAVAEIVGRSDDVLRLPRVGSVAGTTGGPVEPDRGDFHPDFVRAAVLAVDGVEDFRVVQRKDDVVEVAVTPPDRADAAREALDAVLARAGLAPRVVVSAPFTAPDPLHKLRRVRREAG